MSALVGWGPDSESSGWSSGRRRALMRVGGFAFAVALERWSIARGSRRARHVDARTDQAPTVRQTVLLLVAGEAIKWLLDRVLPRVGAGQQRSASEMRQELWRVKTEHPDDTNARTEAVMQLHRKHRAAAGQDRMATVLLPIALRVVVGTAISRGPMPFLRERRTLADLVAGTKLAPREPSRWVRPLRRDRRF